MKILSKLLGAASAAVILAAVPAFVPSLSPVVTASAVNAGNSLTGNDLAIYNAAKNYYAGVAAGTTSETKFTYTFEGYKSDKHWTASDLADYGINTDTLTEDIISNFMTKVDERCAVDSQKVVKALLADCPYEFYWIDNSVDYTLGSSGIGVQMYGNSTITYFVITSDPVYTMTFKVSTPYQGDNDQTINTSVASSTSTTVNSKVNSIISSHSSESDYDRLHSYMDEICGLVEYDTAAASAGANSSNSGSWQMINVFDGNSSTNVVCEGYSKAFKYLCDNSSWSSSVNCYLVTGKLSSEDHMWNIVTIGSDAYLVDVTNSDGLPSGSTPLFLRGGTSLGDSYTFSRGGSDNLTFTYDSDTTSLWSSSILTLATSDYKAPAELEIKHSLTLGDDIGVNFYVKNWTDADAYMTFTVNGKNTTDNGSVYNDMQKFTCTVNSLEMGMDISAVYHYSGGTKSETYSVSQYINDVNANPSNFDAATVKLANATADYGHYVQQYLFELHPGISGNYTAMSNINTLDSSDISNAISGLSSSDYDLIRDSSGSGIKNVTFSLYLDAKTSIYLYLNPAKDYTGTPTVSPYSVENVGGKYRIVVPGLGAYQLGTIYSVTVTANGNFTISNISAYAYAKLILNSGTTSDKAKYAMAALYNYCEAAKDYRTAHSS